MQQSRSRLPRFHALQLRKASREEKRTINHDKLQAGHRDMVRWTTQRIFLHTRTDGAVSWDGRHQWTVGAKAAVKLQEFPVVHGQRCVWRVRQIPAAAAKHFLGWAQEHSDIEVLGRDGSAASESDWHPTLSWVWEQSADKTERSGSSGNRRTMRRSGFARN